MGHPLPLESKGCGILSLPLQPHSREDKKGHEMIWARHLSPSPSSAYMFFQDNDLLGKVEFSSFYLSTSFKLQKIAAPQIQYYCNDETSIQSLILVIFTEFNSQITLVINFSRLNNINIPTHSVYIRLYIHLIVCMTGYFCDPHVFIFFSKLSARILSFQVRIHKVLLSCNYFSQCPSR